MITNGLLNFVLYISCFVAGRGGIFVFPILLANLLSGPEYGSFEFAYAVASLGSAVMAVGTSAVVPLVLVRKVSSASWRSVLGHQIGCVVALGGLSIAALVTALPAVVWLGALSASALMLQGLWSVTLKSNGKSGAALLLDAGFWGLVALGVLAAYLVAVPEPERGRGGVVGLVCYLAALVSWTVVQFVRADPDKKPGMYVATVRSGFPLMVTSVLALLATTSGRLGLGIFSTPEMLADYAVLFRVTALPIVAHQIIVVAYFRRIFELPVAQLERRLPTVVALVTVAVVIFWALSSTVSELFGRAFVSAFSRNRANGLLILIQSILWSGIALNDLVNARSQTAGRVVRGLLWYLALALPLCWWLLSSVEVTLSLYVPVHSIVMAGYFLVQVVVMWRAGIRLARTWTFTLGSFLLLSAMTQIS